MLQPSPKRAPYFVIAFASLLVALTVGWTTLAKRIDNYHYDWMLWLFPPSSPALHTVILEIDDKTLQAFQGMRPILSAALERLAEAQAKVVLIDVLLIENSRVPSDDQQLAALLPKVPNLVLSADIMRNDEIWQEPYKLFAPAAKAVGHVHADPDEYDGVSREVLLEKVAQRKRHWALALEGYRIALGGDPIVESPKDLRIGKNVIPVPRRGDRGRPMLIRYRRGPIEHISVKDLDENPALSAKLMDKVVFVGVTSQSEVRDRLVTPYTTSPGMPGVEIHSHIYETLAQKDFLWPAANISIVVTCIVLAFVPAVVFAFLSGWQAYAGAAFQIFLAHTLPYTMFSSNIVFPLLAPAASAWLSAISCAAWGYFAVRKQLRQSEADRSRYQQAIHFVSHEMKSPLTAIQGSSELMSRYNLSDEKRKQIAQMINSESKRLAKMIQTFLDVERLSEGQMQLKREPFSIDNVVIVCIERARPLAERKRIELHTGEMVDAIVLGDSELMEYAVYNLLSNAVKYSPAETHVHVGMHREAGRLHIAVRDQGIGMDDKELKKIGTKFFRTKRAEQSGEAGTGIGLSIVNQIVEHHGGRMEVTSTPGHGSCFTVIVPLTTTEVVK
jgi:signal transduction histidine kinase